MNRKVVSEDVLFCLFARFVLRTLNISFCGLHIAKSSALAVMAIAGSKSFFSGKDKSQFSIPPNIFRRI